jgi:hypothetical protein
MFMHVSSGDHVQSNERVGGIKQRRARSGVMRFKLRFLIYASTQPASKRASICAGETRRARNNGRARSSRRPPAPIHTHTHVNLLAQFQITRGKSKLRRQIPSSSANVPLLFWLMRICVCVAPRFIMSHACNLFG